MGAEDAGWVDAVLEGGQIVTLLGNGFFPTVKATFECTTRNPRIQKGYRASSNDGHVNPTNGDTV